MTSSTLAHYSREAMQGQREHIEKLEAENARFREALDLVECVAEAGERYAKANSSNHAADFSAILFYARAALGETL